MRYANPEGIFNFLDREDVEKHIISICGRCPSNILSMANSLIGQAPGRSKQPLSPREETSDGEVSIVQWPDVEAEIDGIVAAIASDIGSGRREPGDILVLTNWRKIGEGIRTRLGALEIPARSFFSQEELTSDDGRRVLALLRLIVDENDYPALRVLLSLGDASGRTDAYQRLLSYCRTNNTLPKTVLENIYHGSNIVIRIPAFTKIYGIVRKTVDHLRQLELADLVDELFPENNELLADLRNIARGALAEVESVKDLLRVIVESITQDDVPQNPDFVRIMSLHKSKGLTSLVVYIVGAIHGVIPTLREADPSLSEAAFQEGRRLFYVAVTRSAQELVISSSMLADLADANARGVSYDKASIRRVGGRHTVKTIATPYLGELGPDSPAAVRGQIWLANR
jgi:DNA helicase-2/ATP-dependent DNA helicase PcrA